MADVSRPTSSSTPASPAASARRPSRAATWPSSPALGGDLGEDHVVRGGLQERAGRPPRAAERRDVPLQGGRPAIHRGGRRGQPRPAASTPRRARPGASSSTARSGRARISSLTAGVSYNDTQIKDDTLAVGICAQCTVTRSDRRDRRQRLARWSTATPSRTRPDWIFDVTARWGTPVEQQRRDLRLHRLGLPGRDQLLPLRVRGVRHRRPDRGRAADRLRRARRQLGGRAVRAATSPTRTTSRAASTSTTIPAFVNEPRTFGISARFNY